MKKLSNVELSKRIQEELSKKGYEVKFEKILNDMDVTFDEVENFATENDIENIIDGYLAELEYIED